jgi:hypothetical protein
MENDSLDLAEDFFKQIVPQRKIFTKIETDSREDHEVNSESPNEYMASVSHITQCCPDVQNREMVSKEEREKNILNDLIEASLKAYPEEIRDSIRQQVLASMTSS